MNDTNKGVALMSQQVAGRMAGRRVLVIGAGQETYGLPP